MSARFWIVCAGIAGATGVIAGAFGAHGLEGKVAEDLMEIWQTAATYQLFHAPALLGVGILVKTVGSKRSLSLAGGSFLFGILVFSGSLYLLVLTGQRWLGAITPIGGFSLILGWISLMFADTGEERREG
jgi:uncharacterized membrane protein YgdD (TMEM256/DUF423 family)